MTGLVRGNNSTPSGGWKARHGELKAERDAAADSNGGAAGGGVYSDMAENDVPALQISGPWTPADLRQAAHILEWDRGGIGMNPFISDNWLYICGVLIEGGLRQTRTLEELKALPAATDEAELIAELDKEALALTTPDQPFPKAVGLMLRAAGVISALTENGGVVLPKLVDGWEWVATPSSEKWGD